MASVPFDQLEGEIWFNGEFVPWKDAKIHVLTHGLHYASAVFEGERAYGGEIFKLTEHTERLHTSADILGFKIPYSVAEIDQACVELLARQGFEDAYVRPIAWRGSEMMGVSAQANRINLAIAIWQWPSYFKPEERMKGIRLDMAEYRRPDPRTAPSRSKAAGLYMICTLSKHREKGGVPERKRRLFAVGRGGLLGSVADDPAADLVFLDRFEQRPEVALAKAFITLALDELEEDRPDHGLGEDLQQDLGHAAVDHAFAVDQDAVFLHPVDRLVVAVNAVPREIS
jgi:hypothetical protein